MVKREEKHEPSTLFDPLIPCVVFSSFAPTFQVARFGGWTNWNHVRTAASLAAAAALTIALMRGRP